MWQKGENWGLSTSPQFLSPHWIHWLRRFCHWEPVFPIAIQGALTNDVPSEGCFKLPILLAHDQDSSSLLFNLNKLVLVIVGEWKSVGSSWIDSTLENWKHLDICVRSTDLPFWLLSETPNAQLSLLPYWHTSPQAIEAFELVRDPMGLPGRHGERRRGSFSV